jgi:hypothetical protein
MKAQYVDVGLSREWRTYRVQAPRYQRAEAAQAARAQAEAEGFTVTDTLSVHSEAGKRWESPLWWYRCTLRVK